jgi:Protein of unknown function (DUF1254)
MSRLISTPQLLRCLGLSILVPVTLSHRDLPVENTGVLPNRDTFYSFAVFDLDAGPVTITLPDAGKRFMSLMVIRAIQGAGRRWRHRCDREPRLHDGGHAERHLSH